MEDSLILQLSGCSPATPSPRPSNSCRLVPLLGTPSKAPDLKSSNKSFQKTARSTVLHGVVAYVDVRSESDNRSRAVGHELEQLGATVVDRFSDDVTHLVYKDGKKRTLDMALRRKIHLVSVLWVESCKQSQWKVAEDEFRVILPKKQTPVGPIKIKRYKSMQPKSFDEEVVLSEEKVRRRQQRKEKVEKLRPLRTPESGRRHNFFVAETCRRSPTMDELVTPTSICVPDTPPSMRRHLAKSRSARRASGVVRSPPVLSLLVSPPLQRKFSFDDNDSTPEAISLSSGSHPLSRSSQDDSHPSVVAPPRPPSTNAPQKTLTESISPEIELQTSAKSLPRFMNSSSSFETEKKETDFKTSDSKPKNNDIKLSMGSPHSKGSPCSSILGLSGSRIKRLHSPSIEEISGKRPRMGETVEQVETKRQVESMPPVSLIPLSQWKSDTPSRKNPVRRATRDGHDSENLSADTKLEDTAEKKLQPKTLKSFVHSSPTSSQEASSRDHKGVTLFPSRALPLEPLQRQLEHRISEVLPEAKGFLFEAPSAVVTPCNRPPTCADSLVLETRAQKRRSLAPFHDGIKTDTRASSRRKTLMNGELGSDRINDSTVRSISPAKVVVQRLPGAWDQPKGINNTPVTRRVLSEKAEAQFNAERGLNGVESEMVKTPGRNKRGVGKRGESLGSPSMRPPNGDVGKGVSNGVNSSMSPKVREPSSRDVGKSRANSVNVISPNVKTPNRNILKSRSHSTNAAISPKSISNGMNTTATQQPKRDSEKRAGVGADSTEREKSNGARKTGNQRKMKKSAATSSTSSSDSVVRCDAPSIVITSLHRDEQKIVSDVVQSLGSYVLSENIDEQTTHVVAGGNRRTVKVLAGISRGLWIVSLDWVKCSAERGNWLPEAPFELNNFFPAAKLSRLEMERRGRGYRQDLFSDVGDVFVAEGSAPPKEELEGLVTLCQGKVTKQLRTAKVCVGKFLRQSITNVSEKWILDCITQHQCLPTTDYALTA